MSVQSEITRLETAKAAIVAAVEGKGVTVPDGAKLDALAALVESIRVGGGGNLKFVIGEFTPAEDTLGYGQVFYGGQGTIDDLGITVQHNLGMIPKIGMLMCKTRFTGSLSVKTVESAIVYENNGEYSQFAQGYYNKAPAVFVSSNQSILLEKNTLNVDSSGCFLNATENDIFIANGSNYSGYMFKSGYTYMWVFGG